MNRLPLKNYVTSHLKEDQMDELAILLGNKTVRTQLLNNPQKATNTQLLAFSRVLSIPAYTLYIEYELGKNKVSELELEQHKLVFDSVKA